MSAGTPIYRDQLLEVEPTGIEFVTPQQRHGSPRGLFGVWFSANAEIATWMVGVFAVALYGTTLMGAAVGLLIGNVAGFAVLGILATFGPRYGLAQMVASRFAFGRYGNAFPAALSFLAGVGWFAINTVFGAYALQTITKLPYGFALTLMLVAQITLAVYGYNMIHWFERVSAVLLAAGFALLGALTFSRADWHGAFNAHAPAAAGGEIGGIIFASALGFSYATGWVPCASDYSRYLPESTDPRSVWSYSFFGAALPCVVLQIMGAAAVTAVRDVNFAVASPTQAIAALLGTGTIGTLVLLTVVLGTLTANCMNLYSGAMAALVVKFPGTSWGAPLATAAIFAVVTALLFLHAGLPLPILAAVCLTVACIVLFIGRYRLARWKAALLVGIFGALLATGGGHPGQTAQLYTNFLLLLSYWASPWAAAVLTDWLLTPRRAGVALDGDSPPKIRAGAYGWIFGLAASLPFWNQQWYTGVFAAHFPQLGDVSYYVGFAVAALLTALLKRETGASCATTPSC